MGEPEQAGAAAAPRAGPAAAQTGMILTPDQRVRVFISSTLGELAAERAAARRAAMIDGIRAAGTVSYRTFATPQELKRLPGPLPIG